jgi:competence protein ComGA
MLKIKDLVLEIIKDAIEMKASDIHFGREETDEVMISFRSGSLIIPRKKIEHAIYEQLLAYIKFHATLDLAHPMQPQSGNFYIDDEDFKANCRVLILPASKFTSLVLRVMSTNTYVKIEDIPYFEDNVAKLQEAVSVESGLVLIGGPSESGKSTTLYALVDYLKKVKKKSVITIEDPIEYQPDIAQFQASKPEPIEPVKIKKEATVKPVKSKSSGMNYDVGIKEILRHDPDVIVIGEIRDANTARQAMRATMTGHLVLSTLHSKDCMGMIHRLLDLELKIDEIQNNVVSLINQRIVKPDSGRDVALMEICQGDDLENVFDQIETGKMSMSPYRTLDKEYIEWKTEMMS